MEPLDIELRGTQGTSRFRSLAQTCCPRADADHNSPECCGNRLIPLRKYSLAICAIEALAILLFVYLLIRAPDSSTTTPSTALHTLDANNYVTTTNSSLPPYRVYSSGPSTSTFYLGLFPACNQRVHDAKNARTCYASHIEACEPVEQIVASTDGSDDHEPAKPVAPPTAARNVLGYIKQKLRQESRGQELRASVVLTSLAGARLLKEARSLARFECPPGSTECLPRHATRVEVRVDRRKQKILGWGGALTDSSVQNILSLTTNATRHLLDDYFGPQGLMYNFVRISIGGSDFSSRFYTNDDSNVADLYLNMFKLREEDLLNKIPLLKFITDEYKSRKLKFFASMWSPPIWMKTNNHFNKGQLRGTIDNKRVDLSNPPSKELYYNALSNLKVKFLLAYQERGVNFWGMTVMNEPLFAVQPFLNFNTMIFPSDDYANYVAKYLGPKLKNVNSTLRHIKLMAHDDNRRYLLSYTKPILEDPRVLEYIDGVSVHGYADEEYWMMDSIYNEFKHTHNNNFFILPTELCSGHLPFMQKALVGNWHRGIHYALDIMRSLQHSASGWVDWNMALDTSGGPGWLGGRLDAPIIVDRARDLYHKSPMFYVLGHFSRYITPDSYLLETSVHNAKYDNPFEVVSFELAQAQDKINNKELQTPKQMATIILNTNPYPIDVYLKLTTATASNHQETPNDQNTFYLLNSPADSLITLVYTLK